MNQRRRSLSFEKVNSSASATGIALVVAGVVVAATVCCFAGCSQRFTVGLAAPVPDKR
jgi:hypothetical protein